MITYIQNLPANMVGFKASNEVTESDFEEDVMPKVKELVTKTDELNYMLILDTSVKNFTAGAWFKDAVMGVKHLTKWNRAAIVSDEHGVKMFTDVFSVLMPGEFKAFEHKDQQEAIDWVSGQN
ncbi:STAS/SEC14 domain-containing protein [Cytophaga aurantiaca]|uniref:STAS/SEC14 domain-containing protein n=1 Tax=Cytophaga aurantiaca TaxID=29530 RepID=UPI00036688D6|nr:STAS/SEC14 domain-containing protein [Cytophaga aurantiaca]